MLDRIIRIYLSSCFSFVWLRFFHCRMTVICWWDHCDVLYLIVLNNWFTLHCLWNQFVKCHTALHLSKVPAGNFFFSNWEKELFFPFLLFWSFHTFTVIICVCSSFISLHYLRPLQWFISNVVLFQDNDTFLDVGCTANNTLQIHTVPFFVVKSHDMALADTYTSNVVSRNGANKLCLGWEVKGWNAWEICVILADGDSSRENSSRKLLLVIV